MRHALEKKLRKQLEITVIKAREIAEQAALEALTRLSVGEAKAADYLDDQQRALRNRLRAHGRQLGDERSSNGQQQIDRLCVEIAYEHWHRMLFARFLEQSHLLMYDQHTALTLDECQELAPDEGCANGWELAGKLASRMLPQVFREGSPALAVPLAFNHVRDLEKLIAGLNAEIFQCSDSLGWVYQYWQTKKKMRSMPPPSRSVPTNSQLLLSCSLNPTWFSSYWTTASAHGGSSIIRSIGTYYRSPTYAQFPTLRKRAFSQTMPILRSPSLVPSRDGLSVLPTLRC